MRIPSYRLHKASGQAVVTLNGKDHYLGKHGSVASRREYDRLITIWIAGGRRPISREVPDTTVNEVILGFLRWSETYYRKDGRETSQVNIIKGALKDLYLLFGRESARAFGPMKLETLRSHWVGRGLSRSLVNRRIKIVKQAFGWATARELVPGETYQALRSLRSLAKGRTTAPERSPVLPVPGADVAAVLLHLDGLPIDHPSATLASMVRIQLLTGMRPGELVAMRTSDIDRTGEIWIYRPRSHKTLHRDRERIVYLGPRCQEILTPILVSGQNDYGPFRSIRGKPMSPKLYRQAIARVCRAAGVEPWSPSRLRHNYATTIRREAGLEATKVMLGHSKVETSQIYAEIDTAKAADIARRFG